jgi:hypothetical protein
MQIKYLKTGKTDHVSPAVGCALVNAGVAEEILPPTKPKPKPNLVWTALRGRRVEDYEFPPFLQHHCTTCGANGRSEGPTAHASVRILHCGISETCSRDAAEKYVALRKEYVSRQEAARKARKKDQRAARPVNPLEDPNQYVVDPEILRLHGIKSRAQLIAQAPKPLTTGQKV